VTVDELKTLAEALAERWGFKDEDDLRAHLFSIRLWQIRVTLFGSLARHMLWAGVGWATIAAIIVLLERLGLRLGGAP